MCAKALQKDYARVSSQNVQDTKAQVDALEKAGIKKLYEEIASGGRWDRPELHRMLDQLRKNDVVIVWKLDRLSRSLRDLLHGPEGANQQKVTVPKKYSIFSNG